MIQMASVSGEQERSMLRSRVLAGLERVRAQGTKLGRPKVSPKVEDAIRRHLRAGSGILKIAAMVGCGSGTCSGSSGRWRSSWGSGVTVVDTVREGQWG